MGNITLKNVSKSFGATSIIPNIDLVIEDGEFVVFVGPSGCGKSTLLRLIAGLEDTSGGTINIDGRDVTGEAPAKRKLAMVFQSYALYPHMTVAKNIGFPLKMAGEDVATIDKKVKDADLAAAVGELRRQPRRVGQAGAERLGRGGRERAHARVGGHHGDARAVGGEDPARGVGGQLQDLVDAHRGVDRDRGVGQRAELHHVLVLEPGDLLDLGVAAVDALEGRQALAQEVLGRLQGGVRRRGAPALEHAAQRGVVGLGEVCA